MGSSVLAAFLAKEGSKKLFRIRNEWSQYLLRNGGRKMAGQMGGSSAILPQSTHMEDKVTVNQLAMAISGHGLYSAHLWHWKNIDPVCKLCKESAETSAHLWNECPALEKLRLTKNSLFMCNRSEEVEYTRIDLYNDVLFYFNSPTVRGLVEDNERLLESAMRRTEEIQTTLDDPGTEEDSDDDQTQPKYL